MHMTIKQLYPNVRAQLLCNYAKAQVVNPLITFSRASSATYWDPNDTLREVSTNQPRFDHDPVTGVSKGLLIEGQRTNFLLRNTDLSNAAWRKVNATVALTTTGGAGTPLTASIITASSADAWVAQYGSGSTAGAHAFTILARRRTGTGEVRVSRGQNTGGAGVGPILFSETFDNNNNGWFWNGTWSITGGQFVGTALTTIMPATVPLPATMVAGLSYSVTYTIVSITGSIRPRFDQGLQGIEASTRNTAGTFTDIIRMNQGNTQYRYFPTTNNTDVVIDNITIRPYMPAPITLTSQWQRLDLGQDTTNSVRPQPALAIYMATSGDQIDVAYAQGEAGTTPSSSIPTTGAASTRAVDILQVSLSSLAAPTSAAGTYVIKYQVPQLATTANQVICELNSGAATQVTRLVNQPVRTNSNRNPRAEGATGVTPPTFWAPGVAGYTVSYTKTTRGGIDGVDIAFSGTSTGLSDQISMAADVFSQIVASSGQTWTSSWFVQLVSGSLPAGLTNFRIDTTQRNAAGSFLDATSTTFTPTSIMQRVVCTRTLTAGTERVSTSFRIDVAASTTATFTLFLGQPQLEQGAFATSPMLPTAGTTSTSTRAAGTITLASEHTAIGHYAYANVGTITTSTNAQVVLNLDGTGTIKSCQNGGTVSTLTGAATSGFTTLVLGNDVSGNSALFGTIGTQSVYLVASISDTQLQSLSRVGT